MSTRRMFAALMALTLGFGTSMAGAMTEREEIPSFDDFAGSGNWTCPDGGNYYLGKTTAAGPMQVKNNGIGKVSVHVTYANGTSDVYHLQPGACLNRNIPAGVHVDVFDGGKDTLDASGTYKIP